MSWTMAGALHWIAHLGARDVGGSVSNIFVRSEGLDQPRRLRGWGHGDAEFDALNACRFDAARRDLGCRRL